MTTFKCHLWLLPAALAVRFRCGMNYTMEFDPGHRVLLLVTGGDGDPTRVWTLRLKSP
ncbi:MAG: hypothetical protein HZA46_17135 [Planctomycetales bacterium]|nr:hypothetical protein [Planctomycetales bacterium]